MPARERIIQILSSPEASRIRFSFLVGTTRFTIFSQTFQRVARAFRHGHIRINFSATMPSGVRARYHSDTDTMDLTSLIGRRDEGAILHECLHAYYDIEKTAIDAPHEEGAAYVVTALYYQMSGATPPRQGNEQRGAANVVADGLLQAYQDGSAPVPEVNDEDWNKLLEELRNDPDYKKLWAGTTGSYLHNGVR
jgi:hypothetical protein